MTRRERLAATKRLTAIARERRLTAELAKAQKRIRELEAQVAHLLGYEAECARLGERV